MQFRSQLPATSITGQISVIGRLIEKRSGRSRASIFPRSPGLFLRQNDDRWRDIKIDEAAIKLLNWFRLATVPPFSSAQSRTEPCSSNLSRFVSNSPHKIHKGIDITEYRAFDVNSCVSTHRISRKRLEFANWSLLSDQSREIAITERSVRNGASVEG